MASLRDLLRQTTRPALAVDFGADFVAVRHAPPGDEWTELGAVAVDAPDFAIQMAALASRAGEITGGDMRAELWLPASQIVNLEIEDQPRLDMLARRGAAEHLAEAIGLPADQLSFDLAAAGADGRRSACATETSTVDEARVHAAAWGFDPTIITTRHAGPAFTRPPRFDAAGPRRPLIPVMAAAAVVLVALGLVGVWSMRDGPHQPPVVNLETVATAPTPAHEPAHAEEELALDAAENAPTQKEPPTPVASLAIEATAPEGSETQLDFRVVSDATALSTSPAQDAPLAVQNDARVAVEGGTGGSIAPELLVEPQVARSFVADQTPVTPPLAAPDAPESVTAALTPAADVPPLGDIAIAKADPSSADQRAEPPVAPLQERAPAPDTGIAPVDPVEFAADAKEWIEAEGDAEVETGASTPLLSDDEETVAVESETDPAQADVAAEVPSDDGATEAVVAETASGTEEDITEDTETAEAEAETSDVSADTQIALLPSPAPRTSANRGPALAESDDFDDIDLGPGPGSVLTAPVPGHRPAALDMTPSDLAVLTAPSPGHRPSSIKPRAKPVVRNTRTASTPSRGKPSGPGLARAATLVDVIPLDDLSLLGTFGQGQSRRALLRMPSGEVVRVSRGDVVQGWVVGKIEPLSMRVTRGGEARTLPLAR